MAGFDFTQAAVAGYKFTWRYRGMIARYALPLFLVKFASFVIITSFDLKITPLRQGLILLPSYCIEGWLLAVLIRFYVRLIPSEQEGSRAILATTLMYVLIKLFIACISGLSVPSQAGLGIDASTAVEPSMGMYVAAMIAISALIWAFRLLWFYVPVALEYPLRQFAEKIAAFTTSFYMIGTWLICIMPAALTLILFSQLLLSGVPSDGAPSAMYHFIMIAAQTIVEIFMAIVSSIAMAHGFREMMTGAPRA